MSQVNFQINFKWWHESKEIKEPTLSLLKEDAIESIFEMLQHGYLSGSLETSHLEEGEEVFYRGHWECKQGADEKYSVSDEVEERLRG
jgi:hypothetical protein